ncbi:MAG TPA: recombinase family protein, partial [Acidimicrobiales bacterium]
MEVVGVYARLSKLRGRTEKIETQHELGSEAARGRWPECEVRLYADPDASGEREDVVRDDYERLKADLLAGALTQVATSDQERLTRRPDELERLITVFRTAGVPGFLGYRDGWTSLIDGQSAGARYKGVGAKEYVEGMRVKTNERLAVLAAAGRPGPGTSFGYRHQRDASLRSWLVVVEAEAAAARWGAEMLLSGWKEIEVARAWDERGIEGRRGGGPWALSPGRVMRALTSPTIAGKRVYRGEIVGDAEWDPILDEVTWRRVCALAESRKGNHPARRYLLTSGLTECAECDRAMKGM